MKIKTVVCIVLVCLAFIAVPVSAGSVGNAPQLAEQFYGTVTANGTPMPAGAEIWAYIDGNKVASFLVTEPGKIGGPGTWDDKFLVSGTANGDEISFFVNGCGYTAYKASYQKGTSQEIALAFTGTPIIYYAITKTPSEHGTYTVSAETAQADDTVTIAAIPDSGYKFDKLTVKADSGVTVPVSGTSFTMPASAVTLTVTFATTGGGGGGSGGDPVNPGIPVISGPFSYGGYTNLNPLSAFGILYASGLSFTGNPSYISEIDGMKEGYYGGLDGWMFAVNGAVPMVTCGNAILSPGDTLTWYYSKDMAAAIKDSPKSIVFRLASNGKTFTMQKSGSGSGSGIGGGIVEDPTNPLINPDQTVGKNIVLASPYTIDEVSSIPENGIVTLDIIEQITEVQVPLSVVREHPDAVLVVTEGTETALALPSSADAANVVGVFDISVLNADGEEISVSAPGSFTLRQTVPAGKTLVVGHQKSNGKWESCDVTGGASGEWIVAYTSLSPFVSYLLNAGEENPFISVEPTSVPTVRPTFAPTEQPKSPMPLFAVIAGVIGAALLLGRRS
ncbi:MAG TPA: DUF4430 domain-containing protein [Methanocorpusculum sp.]|nr:DUF4430 domain-containing protein [Methanocorpusculum sp.]